MSGFTKSLEDRIRIIRGLRSPINTCIVNVMPLSPEPIFDLVRRTIDLAILCVDTGQCLVPFLMTEGKPGAVISIVAASADESLILAQQSVKKFDSDTTAFAFAYDGFITMHGERSDAVYVEASFAETTHIYVFVQRYAPRESTTPVTRIGNWAYLQQNEARLQPVGAPRKSD